MSRGPASSTGTFIAPKGSLFPKVLFVHGAEQRELTLSLLPLSVGRRTGKDIEIPDPRISRDHAEIVNEDGSWYVVDVGSKLGSFVNGERVDKKRKLVKNDRVEFGVGVGAHVIFDPQTEKSSEAREFLSQISAIGVQDKANDLEKLALFLEAARKLNTAGALDEIMLSLIATTLKLTNAERGFIFLRQPDGSLVLSAACTTLGERITTAENISNSILSDAVNAASEFMITDTSQIAELAGRQSIIAHDLRTVIAIPLRKAAGATAGSGNGDSTESQVLGVLYLDSHFVSGAITGVGQDILSVIAREAAALVESTNLAQMEETSRRYQQELNIANTIQQRLMTVQIPELSYASLSAKNIPCRDIGGDFFDLVVDEDGLAIVVTDVSGKGISAAILASILQGLIYAQLVAKVPLEEIVTSTNQFLCQRVLGEKYATVVILRLKQNGEMEFVNCGHIPPMLVRSRKVERTEVSNLPVGMLEIATYEAGRTKLEPGDRVVLVTDGVTEAENSDGEFFGEERLEETALSVRGPCFDHLFAAVRQFCGDTPMSDDCTLVELVYRGGSKDQSDSNPEIGN